MPRKESPKRRAVHDATGEKLRLLEELLGSVGDVLWLRDLREERLIYVSPAFAEIWGRSVESLMNQPRLWVESIHPDDRDRVLSQAINEGRSGLPDAVEYRIRRPDGKIRWISDRAFPVRNKEGQVYRLAGIAEDVTERRKG